MISLQSAENALKEAYLSVACNQLNTQANPLLAKIKQSSTDVYGKNIIKPCQVGLNGGVGAGTETGRLPTASGNNYKQFKTTLKNLYGTFEISDKAIRASSANPGAFVNLLNAEIDGLLTASKFNLGRMLYGDGTGVIATVTATNTNNTISCSDVKNMAVGMNVEIYAAATDQTTGNAGRITDIDRENKTITIGGTTIAASAIKEGMRICVAGSLNNEITGLGAIFKSTGSLYGLDRATHKWLVPYMKTSVGDISETVIQKAIDYLDENAGSKVNFIVCSSGVKRAFQKHLATYKRNVDVMNLEGGYKAISYNGIPIVSDRFCPAGTMYLLNTDDFTLHQLCDWKWLEGDDGKVLKQDMRKPTYTATLVKYADIICAKPCGQAMLSGITEE